MHRSRLVLAIAMIAASSLSAAPGRAGASPFLAPSSYFGKTWAKSASPYTATYVGSDRDVRRIDDAVVNTRTGESFQFLRPATDESVASLTTEQRGSLPTTTAYQGGMIPVLNTYGLKPLQANEAGTVLGVMPLPGSQSSDPWLYTSGYYVALQREDGSYSPAQFLGFKGADQVPTLTESNQVYVRNAYDEGLFDPVSGLSTAVKDLVPPELTARYRAVSVHGISSRGDLLVELWNPNSPTPVFDDYILSPTTTETPVPEPAMLLIVAVAAGSAVRRLRR